LFNCLTRRKAGESANIAAMSHQEVFAYLQNNLRNIQLKDLVPAIPEFRAEELANISHYDHPNFPVFVCTIFIAGLGLVVIALRFICIKIDANKRKQSSTHVKAVDVRSGAEKIVEIKDDAPKAKPRWKKPVVEQQEAPKKIIGLKSKSERDSSEKSKV